MAIAPISSVSFRNNYINFEGKKRNNDNRGIQIPDSAKAVPLAVLIAMSPLSDAYAQNQQDYPKPNLKKEYYKKLDNNDTKIGLASFPLGDVPWDGKKVMTSVQIYDSNGDESNYEKMVIETFTPQNWQCPDKIYVKDFVIESTYNTDTKETKNRYIIEGLRTTTRRNADGNYIERQKSGASTTVNKEVFDVLKQELGDAMKIQKIEKTTNNREIEETNTVIDILTQDM